MQRLGSSVRGQDGRDLLREMYEVRENLIVNFKRDIARLPETRSEMEHGVETCVSCRW